MHFNKCDWLATRKRNHAQGVCNRENTKGANNFAWLGCHGMLTGSKDILSL